MIAWLRDKYETWRLRRWIKKHTMTQEQLERALEERYGIPRRHEVSPATRDMEASNG